MRKLKRFIPLVMAIFASLILIACSFVKKSKLEGKWKVTDVDDELELDLDDYDVYFEFEKDGDFEMCMESEEYDEEYCIKGEWDLDDDVIEIELDDDEGELELKIDKLTRSKLKGELSAEDEEEEGDIEFKKVD